MHHNLFNLSSVSRGTVMFTLLREVFILGPVVSTLKHGYDVSCLEDALWVFIREEWFHTDYA